MMYAVSRAETCAKIFFVISFVGVFVYIFLGFYTFRSAYLSMSETRRYQKKLQIDADPNVGPVKRSPNVKNILVWTFINSTELLNEGRKPFVDYDCLHQNCYITYDIKHLDDYTKFDAVVLNTKSFQGKISKLPTRRSVNQKYVFFSKRPAMQNPVCHAKADGFFNWTWTYKLYSDIPSPFIIVKNLEGNVVAPSYDAQWHKQLYAQIDYLKQPKPTTKTKAMAYVMPKKICGSIRGNILNDTIGEIKTIFARSNMEFDIFGCDADCGIDCLRMIERDYYFYFVLEGQVLQDYLTADVMTAFKTNTVPVIMSSVDLTKFLPPGSYIQTTQKPNIEELESTIGLLYHLQTTQIVYESYFRWKKYYTIEKAPYFYGLCQLCSYLNNDELMSNHFSYQYFRRWWFPGPLQNSCMKSKVRNISDSLIFRPKSRPVYRNLEIF